MELSTAIMIGKFTIYAVFFLALAFFSGSETAITSLNRRDMEDAGGLDKFSYWIRHPDKVLSTLLVGTNLAMAGLSVVSVSIAADIAGISPVFAWMAVSLTPVVVLIFTQIIPKAYCRFKAVAVGRDSIGILVVLSEATDFLNRALLKISELLIGSQPSASEPFFRSSREIKRFIDATEGVGRDTRALLKNIIDFRSKNIEDVMIPRRDITAVDISRPGEEIFDKIIKSGYSRLPAYRGTLDNLAGIIYAKDIAFSYRNKDLIVIDDLIRPAYFHPETAKLENLLRKFRQGRFHMAIIVDEHGLITGLVTIEDIVEEIVGEIWDEHDVKESNITRFPDGSVIFRGRESLGAASAELKTALPTDEYSTVGGWITGVFGEIPRSGARIPWGRFEIEVVEADGRRIKQVRIIRSAKEAN